MIFPNQKIDFDWKKCKINISLKSILSLEIFIEFFDWLKKLFACAYKHEYIFHSFFESILTSREVLFPKKKGTKYYVYILHNDISLDFWSDPQSRCLNRKWLFEISTIVVIFIRVFCKTMKKKAWFHHVLILERRQENIHLIFSRIDTLFSIKSLSIIWNINNVEDFLIISKDKYNQK